MLSGNSHALLVWMLFFFSLILHVFLKYWNTCSWAKFGEKFALCQYPLVYAYRTFAKYFIWMRFHCCYYFESSSSRKQRYQLYLKFWRNYYYYYFTASTLKPFLKIRLLTKMDLHLCVCELFWWELSELDPVCKLISDDCFEFERNLIWRLPCSTPCGSGWLSTSSVKLCIVSIWLFLFYLNCFLPRRRNSLQTRQTSADSLLLAKQLKRYLSCD